MGLTPSHREVVRAVLGADRVRGSDVLEMDLAGDEAPEGPEEYPRLRRALRFLTASQRRVIDSATAWPTGRRARWTRPAVSSASAGSGPTSMRGRRWPDSGP